MHRNGLPPVRFRYDPVTYRKQCLFPRGSNGSLECEGDHVSEEKADLWTASINSFTRARFRLSLR